MRFACWIAKAIDTHSGHVLLIAFPRQQWPFERVFMLRYTYILGFLAPTPYPLYITLCSNIFDW